MRRYELSDNHYEIIKDLLSHNAGFGRTRRDPRQVFNGILWVLCSGTAWRNLPERYGPWKTAYHWFREYSCDGTFKSLLKRLHLKLDENELIDPQT